MSAAYPANILCAVDFSDLSAAAVRFAGALTRRTGAALTAIHVHSSEPPPYFTAGMIPELEREAKSATAQAAAALNNFVARESGGLHFDIRVTSGDVAGNIATTAREIGADLIIMGTHGRSGLSRLVLGSVAESVLRESTVPVLTVKDGPCGAVQRVVCDLSIAGTGRALAETLGAECVERVTSDSASEAQIQGADLLVISGATAAAVIRNVPCPVLSIPTQNEITDDTSDQIHQTSR